MSDYAQYPYEALQAVGTNLADIADRIGSSSKDAFEIAGFTTDQDRINQALADFRDEWKESVQKLGENIGGFGDISRQIGTMTAEFDAELARSMRPAAGAAPGRAR
jgi:hypothetical protein